MKIKKINYRKVSKHRRISPKISKNKFCIKYLISMLKNSIIEKLNVWYLCARAQGKRVFRTNYEVEGGLHSRGISTEQFIHEMNVGGLSNVETGKIRIRLKGYDHKAVDQSAAKIAETAKRTGSRVSGPIPLPTERNVYTILRSPHVNKDSREQFEMRIHKRLIDILDPSKKTADALMRLELPAGVSIEIKL